MFTDGLLGEQGNSGTWNSLERIETNVSKVHF